MDLPSFGYVPVHTNTEIELEADSKCVSVYLLSEILSLVKVQ